MTFGTALISPLAFARGNRQSPVPPLPPLYRPCFRFLFSSSPSATHAAYLLVDSSNRTINTLFPVVLISISLIILLSTNLSHVFHSYLLPSSNQPISLPITTDLSTDSSGPTPISPLILENTLIRASANAAYGSEPDQPRSLLEKTTSYLILLLTLVLLSLEIAKGSLLTTDLSERTQGWVNVGLTAYLVVLALLSCSKSFGSHVLGLERRALDVHRTTLVMIYFVIALVDFRSGLIHRGEEVGFTTTSPGSKTTTNLVLLDALVSGVLLVIFLLDVCTPYRSALDGTLTGHFSRGGKYQRPIEAAASAAEGTTATAAAGQEKKAHPYGSTPMIEEPRSVASRALFSYMNPVGLGSRNKLSLVLCTGGN